MNNETGINKIAVLNDSTYGKNNLPKNINYLDTGNLTRNNIDSLKSLNTQLDKIPSRAQRKTKLNTILYSTVRPNQEHYGILEEEIENLIVSTGFTTIDVVDDEILPKYLYYLLTQNHITNYLHTLAQNSVSSYPSILPDDIGALKFIFPNLDIQKQIAKVLSDLDSKIDVNNKINTELEALTKTIYDYWFVQFDFPNANGKPYKASAGKMVYNKTLKKEIPEGWQDKTIADWIEKDKSGDWGKESKQGNYTEQVSCIRGADINGLNGNGEVKAPERFILEKNTHKLLEEGDLIIEISGGSPTQSTGRMAFVTQETLERFENPLICSNFCKAVTLKDETYLYNFVYQWNRLYDAGVLFGWEGKTSGIKNLLFESFVTNYKTVFPKKDIVEKFYQKIKPIHAKKQKNLRENQKLADLRDWLLPMLMNGQVTVKEAQGHINQAAEPQENYS
ncbi:restriction endonuclease subunit S [Algibacter pacificus]|uniref:restriction endonuclease subunit S n=1 Tax=Algibacter pacificus TaxID=2599389 RepID=UPI0011C8CFED|nr:restriction endonuclease subunit S [Algibacter pacificus]